MASFVVLTPSAMVELGTPAFDFALPDTNGETVRLSDFKPAPALLVIFLCNHCPYVKHIANDMAAVTAKYMAKGVAVVGINSNDPVKYPEDSPEAMRQERKRRGYEFPYLFDAEQTVARAYDAQCTPDFFLYDNQRRLVYRGQFCDARPGNGKHITGLDLTRAVDAALGGKPPVQVQKASMGCNIKWK